MGPGFLILAALLVQGTDTATFADAATRELVLRASARHHAQDSSVTDYRARIKFRLTFSLDRRRWGSPPPWGAEEQEGRVAWQLPNDLQVDILGQRARTRDARGTVFSAFDEPWFVPRRLSDSVRVFGNDFPERASLHPLASDGPSWYRYAMGEVLTLTTAAGRQIRIVPVTVAPKRQGPALLAGQLWLDMETGEVVRFAFRYLGTDLWVTPESEAPKDSANARKANQLANRILTLDADLEYALQDGRHWMPYRQVLVGRVQLPMVGDVFVPFEVTTTFDQYEINTGQRITFRLPMPDTARTHRIEEDREARRDSLLAERRARGDADTTNARNRTGVLEGGRYEIHRAPLDSLRAYAWDEEFEFRTTEAEEKRTEQLRREISDLVESLPRDLSGRYLTGFTYERVVDVFRFNRVQGASIGLGYQIEQPWSAYSSLFLTARYGFSDRRPTARLSFVRDAPVGKLAISAYRDISESDPFSRGLSMGNAIRALFSARDEADYYLATGGLVSFETSVSKSAELTVSARLDRHRSIEKKSSAWIHEIYDNGEFPENPAVSEGWHTGVMGRVDGVFRRARWGLALEGLTSIEGGDMTARAYGEWRQPIGYRHGATVRLKGGLATRPTLPQMAFRAGGQGSVRGHTYGIQRGDAFWAIQTDVSATPRPIRPVLFLDAGQAGSLSSLGDARLLVGAGAGISLAGGLIRLELSHPVTPRPSGSGLRLDLVLGAPR